MAKIHKKFKQSKKSKKILKGGAVPHPLVPHPPSTPNPRTKKVSRATHIVKLEPIKSTHKSKRPRPPRSFRIIRNSSSESSDNEYETEQKLKPKSKNTSSGSKSGSKSGSRSGSRSGSTLLRSKSI